MELHDALSVRCLIAGGPADPEPFLSDCNCRQIMNTRYPLRSPRLAASRSRVFWNLLVCVSLTCGWEEVAADVIYQNYDGLNPSAGSTFISWQPNTPPTPNFGSRAALGFTTDSFSYTLDSVTVNLQLNSVEGIRLGLYADSGGSPGTSLGDLGSPGGLGSQANYTFSGGGLPLAASTSYWLVMEPGSTGASAVSALWYTGTSGSGFKTSSAVDTWGPWSPSGGSPPSAYVQASAVPEPAVSALAAGVIMLGVTSFRRWRRPRRFGAGALSDRC